MNNVSSCFPVSRVSENRVDGSLTRALGQRQRVCWQSMLLKNSQIVLTTQNKRVVLALAHLFHLMGIQSWLLSCHNVAVSQMNATKLNQWNPHLVDPPSIDYIGCMDRSQMICLACTEEQWLDFYCKYRYHLYLDLVCLDSNWLWLCDRVVVDFFSTEEVYWASVLSVQVK